MQIAFALHFNKTRLKGGLYKHVHLIKIMSRNLLLNLVIYLFFLSFKFKQMFSFRLIYALSVVPLTLILILLIIRHLIR